VSAAGRKRAVFWLTVGGVSILANFALELVTGLVPQLGLQKFTAFTHLGGAMAQQDRQQ
jgi:hypothetical protein